MFFLLLLLRKLWMFLKNYLDLIGDRINCWMVVGQTLYLNSSVHRIGKFTRMGSKKLSTIRENNWKAPLMTPFFLALVHIWFRVEYFSPSWKVKDVIITDLALNVYSFLLCCVFTHNFIWTNMLPKIDENTFLNFLFTWVSNIHSEPNEPLDSLLPLFFLKLFSFQCSKWQLF